MRLGCVQATADRVFRGCAFGYNLKVVLGLLSFCEKRVEIMMSLWLIF